MLERRFLARGAGRALGFAACGLAMLAVLAGCQVAPRSDPYVAATREYIAELEQWNGAGDMPPEPPEPAYVQCSGFDTHPPALGMDPALLGTPQGSIYLDYQSRSIINTYAYNCSRINRQRKKAYEVAMQRYRVLTAAEQE
jgi:hypothetical protein